MGKAHTLAAGLASLGVILAMVMPGPLSGETNVAPALGAQKPEAEPTRPAVIPILDQLVEERRDLEEKARVLRKEIERAPAGVQRETLQQDLDKLAGRIAALDGDINSLAAGVDAVAFTGAVTGAFDVQREVIELVRPLIEQLRRLSEQPREAERLRDEIDKARARVTLAERAVKNAAGLLAEKSLGAPTRAAVDRAHRDWQARLKAAQSQLDVLEFQLRQMLESKKPIIESLTSMARTFFRVRGKNVLLAIAAAVGAFLLVRWLHERARHSRLLLVGGRSFYGRLGNLLLHLFSMLGAIVAAMLVLYFVGDWLLLGLLIILIVAVALAARAGLARFVQEISILLNLGSVREGERVVIDGIPWRVDQLNFLTTLTNPALPGHMLRLPIRRLPDLVSRPIAEHEPWFPCRLGDWVVLQDETIGKVVELTPEIVQIVKLGGLHKTYPIAAFLAMNPANLSSGFRVSTTFGIDYNHQADCADEIPRLLHDHIFRGLVGFIGHEPIRSLKVELKMAAPSSLDFEIAADFDGSVADRFEALRRALQRHAVEACNEHGWTIPFTQVTLHHAPSSPPEASPIRPA